jgi:hypothetical protein
MNHVQDIINAGKNVINVEGSSVVKAVEYLKRAQYAIYHLAIYNVTITMYKSLKVTANQNAQVGVNVLSVIR